MCEAVFVCVSVWDVVPSEYLEKMWCSGRNFVSLVFNLMPFASCFTLSDIFTFYVDK